MVRIRRSGHCRHCVRYDVLSRIGIAPASQLDDAAGLGAVQREAKRVQSGDGGDEAEAEAVTRSRR
jgi:hypothetical protein